MLNGMTDPQQPHLPPYASNAPQPSGYPAQAAPAAQQQPYYAPAAPIAASATNAAGRIGFILGLVGLGVGLLTSAIVQIVLRSPISAVGFDYAMITLINGAGSLLAFIAAVAALVFGLIGIRKVGAPHAQAGIATGLGLAGVVGGMFTFLLTAASPLFY